MELQQLARERVRDAEALLSAGQWSGAYYLAGYAIEFALKSCIAKLTNLHDYPDKDFAVKCFSHNIETLVIHAGLKKQRYQSVKGNLNLSENWEIVNDWEVEIRYQIVAEPDARKLFLAVTDATDGVLPWIMDRW